jgi:hypothetical protein
MQPASRDSKSRRPVIVKAAVPVSVPKSSNGSTAALATEPFNSSVFSAPPAPLHDAAVHDDGDELTVQIAAMKAMRDRCHLPLGSLRTHRPVRRSVEGGCPMHCTPPTSAPGLGSPRPHRRRDWAHPTHICAGTGFAPPTSASGLGSG